MPNTERESGFEELLASMFGMPDPEELAASSLKKALAGEGNVNEGLDYTYPKLLAFNPSEDDETDGELYYIVALDNTNAKVVNHWILPRDSVFNWAADKWIGTTDDVDYSDLTLKLA